MGLAGSFRRAARRAVHLDIQRANPFTVPFIRLAATLEQRHIRTVIDVGANDGGFASNLFEAGYDGQIISFEPLPDAWDALNRRTKSFGSKWRTGPRLALSDRKGRANFHVANNSESSSLLPMAARHVEADPASRTISTIQVDTAPLDDVIKGLTLDDPLFLKIDVQGVESLVLAGAANALRDRITGVQIEISLVALYDGQSQSEDLIQELSRLGFHLWDIVPGFRDPCTFQLLQYDGVFYR
jgi:FkbM family methyltransferase